MPNKYVVYIVRNASNRLYVGQTKRIAKRIKEHHGSRGASFISEYGGGRIVYSEAHSTLTEARQREQQLKRWSKAKKEALILGDFHLLRTLAKG